MVEVYEFYRLRDTGTGYVVDFNVRDYPQQIWNVIIADNDSVLLSIIFLLSLFAIIAWALRGSKIL